MNRSVLVSTILRCLAMASKFILVVVLAKLLPPQQVGVYSLMVVTVANGVLLAGMQFFLFANRELAAAEPDRRAPIVRNQFVFYGLLYAVVLPLFLIVFVQRFLGWELIGWFYVILVADHISYELQRILAATERAVKSNVIHTIRTGLWVYPLVGILLLAPDARELRTLWVFWLAGSLASIVLALFWLRGLGLRESAKAPVDWDWLKSGIRTTLHYLPVTLILLVMTLMDRYCLERFAGKEFVGAYSVYLTIANIVVTFPEAGIATVMMPKIIAAFAEGNREEHARLLRQFARSLVVTTLVTAALAVGALYAALAVYITDPIYRDMIAAFWVLLGATCLTTISLWPHYDLYSRQKDKEITWVAVAAVIPFIVLNIWLVPRYGIMAAAWALLVSQAIMLAGKWLLARRAEPIPAPA